MMNRIRSRWHIFSYNFKWSSYVWLLNGRVAKLAIGVPLVGYLLLFNDAVSQQISFERLAPQTRTFHGLSGSARLQFLYVGLVALGTANAFYYWFRPFTMRLAEDSRTYVSRALEQFTVTEYINIHGIIRSEGHVTQYGKYYDAEYEEFLKLAGGDPRTALGADWGAARSRFEGLVRGMLIEHYFRYDTRRRKELCFCLLLAAIGYVCLAIPSADLFAKVMTLIVRSLLANF